MMPLMTGQPENSRIISNLYWAFKVFQALFSVLLKLRKLNNNPVSNNLFSMKAFKQASSNVTNKICF